MEIGGQVGGDVFIGIVAVIAVFPNPILDELDECRLSAFRTWRQPIDLRYLPAERRSDTRQTDT